jgi:FkbM family methyltransferase
VRVLQGYRNLRESSSAVRKLHRFVREPYYRALEAIYRRGAPARLVNGASVRLHPRFVYLAETYEPNVTAVLVRYLRSGATVIDVGAHIGLHTLMFSRHVGALGQVLAVEPSPANASLLRRHLAWNGCTNVSVIEAAAGRHEGAIEFVYRPDANDLGGFANSIAYDIGGLRRRVSMTTLDALCDGLVPDLIKIDVEGAELAVLQGAEKLLARAAPTLVIAIHPSPMQAMGGTPADLVVFLNARGYGGHHLDGRPAMDPGFEEIVFEKNGASENSRQPCIFS